MPHDAHNKPLAEGDEVIIRARVTRIYGGEDYCNATLTSVRKRRPDAAFEEFTTNLGVCEKVDHGEGEE